MAFRDLLVGVEEVEDEISVNHDMMEHSTSIGHKAVMFNRIEGTGGLRSALNVLARDRLCSIFKITPGELIDILSWAMENPADPVVVEKEDASVFENTQESVNLTALPIPWHYPEDRGRYQSASVISLNTTVSGTCHSTVNSFVMRITAYLDLFLDIYVP